MPRASGSYGRLAGWQTKYGWSPKVLKFSMGKLFGLLLLLIVMQCYNSVRNPFQSAFFKYCLS